jgi:formylmethanofuran dehydrogenase subunit C
VTLLSKKCEGGEIVLLRELKTDAVVVDVDAGTDVRSVVNSALVVVTRLGSSERRGEMFVHSSVDVVFGDREEDSS